MRCMTSSSATSASQCSNIKGSMRLNSVAYKPSQALKGPRLRMRWKRSCSSVSLYVMLPPRS